MTGSDANFRVVPNGFAPPPSGVRPDAWGGAGSSLPLRIISVSNLVEGKGIDTTMEALGRLAARGSRGWRYRIVGDGDQRGALERRSKALGLSGLIDFLGARPHSEIYPLLADADVFVLPSYREAFGIAYLEAMAMGLLAIGVEGQGPQAFIHHGRTGLLVPPRDVDHLAETLMQVLEDRARFQQMAASGRGAVMAGWTWDSHAVALGAVYGEAFAALRDRQDST